MTATKIGTDLRKRKVKRERERERERERKRKRERENLFLRKKFKVSRRVHIQTNKKM